MDVEDDTNVVEPAPWRIGSAVAITITVIPFVVLPPACAVAGAWVGWSLMFGLWGIWVIPALFCSGCLGLIGFVVGIGLAFVVLSSLSDLF